jgi:hypothetical protein
MRLADALPMANDMRIVAAKAVNMSLVVYRMVLVPWLVGCVDHWQTVLPMARDRRLLH